MIRVGASTIDGGGNPYLSLLYTALRDEGVAVQPADLRPWRLYSGAQRFDVLHIHWPEHIMVGPGSRFTHAARVRAAAIALRSSVRSLSSRGVRIVWTAHNVRPHNPEALASQVNLYRWLAQDADAVIVHTHYAAQLVRERLGRAGAMYLAPHGNYIDVYGTSSVDRKALRARYGFCDSDRVLLAFGQIRAYKRLVELVIDFETRAPPSTRLIIAGTPKDHGITQRLKSMVAASSRVVLLDRYIPESEVGELYAVADLAIFNYAEIFSSGALMLAFSLGLGVLAPKQGAADELVGKPALFAWVESPFEVLNEALEVPHDVRQRAALAAAYAHGWDDAARVHIKAYEGGDPNLP
jgi:beta-1,4-mannosyltransferase